MVASGWYVPLSLLSIVLALASSLGLLVVLRGFSVVKKALYANWRSMGVLYSYCVGSYHYQLACLLQVRQVQPGFQHCWNRVQLGQHCW